MLQLSHPQNKVFLHDEELLPLRRQIAVQHLRRQRHTGDACDILRSGAQAVLLTAAKDQVADLDTVRHIKQTDSLRRMDLVAARRQKVDMHLSGEDLLLAECLHRIHVKEGVRILLLDGRADLRNGLDRTDLVVCKHDRDQNGILPHGIPHLLRRDVPVHIHRQVRHREALGLQIFHRFQYRRMFNPGGDKMSFASAPPIMAMLSDSEPQEVK